MSARHRSSEELQEIARNVLDSLRPEHLSVGQIKEVAQHMIESTDYIVLREKPAEDE